ncbi:MAG: 4Fe-4S binding protein [Methanoregula sp.]
MQITKSIRRSIGTVLLTAGLAYPACAAVCPKGIGGCTSPGRCFLFLDADGNSLCDYTGRTGSQTVSNAIPSGPGTSAQVPAAPQPDISATQMPVPTMSSVSADTTNTVIQQTTSGGFLETIHVSAFLSGVILFLVFTGIIFALLMARLPGTRKQETGTALALVSLFGLNLSLVATSLLAGGTAVGITSSLIYMVAGPLLVAYLWHAGRMTQRIILLLAGLATFAGFVFLSPIMPLELGGIVNVITGTSALSIAIIVICAVILLALLVGRTFCGSVCPVGSLQELAYIIPVKKIVPRKKEILELIRLVFFIATAAAAISLIDLMAYTGLYDLFSLTLTAGFAVAAGLILLSAFLYRPVCRILCPFGVLFSMFAEFSWFRLQRTETCIGCKKCERACPASTAGRNDGKRECYLCGRCTEACPVPTALRYGR